ncbi:MAG: C40 family peptidase [Bacteroidales bacterium]
MEFGVCLNGFACVRERPDHRSEMVSQLLFGELFEVLETRNGWHHVMQQFDKYQGWVPVNQVELIGFETYEQTKALPHFFAGDLIGIMENETDQTSFPISAGSSVFSDEGSFSLAGKSYQYSGMVVEPSSPMVEMIPEYAMLFLNTPYLWGGRSVFGMDCSGFVQLVCRMSGFKVPRDASIQATRGDTVHLIDEAVAGDLLFFDNHEEEINHVGILLNKGFIIHAHGEVRIDMVDHNGIFNRSKKKYTHRLRLIKRVASL